jgi:hypothetical protein
MAVQNDSKLFSGFPFVGHGNPDNNSESRYRISVTSNWSGYVVDIATGYRLVDRGIGVRIPVGSRTFSSLCRPDQLWGPPSLLPKGYRRLLPRG